MNTESEQMFHHINIEITGGMYVYWIDSVAIVYISEEDYIFDIHSYIVLTLQ